MLKFMFAGAAALLAMLGVAGPATAQGTNRIKCESQNYRPASCAIGDAADVRITQVIGGRCQGDDWRWDRRAIFVQNGCRAFFDVVQRGGGGGGGYPGGGYPGGGFPGGGYPGGGYPGGGGQQQLVTCESRDYQPARCAADTRGGVRITRLRGGQCVQGQTWGFDRGGIWVNRGCRADFIVGGSFAGGGGGYPGGGYPGGGGGYGQVVECSSRNYRPARCPAMIRRGAEVERVLGGECIQGRSWGWDGGAIWVNNGCRARFRVF
ncbi:DUF3011 domain-containing protein [Sandarakinorhabdus sp. DWP1-3-1]|uniref:DUF3011 domain-containing protein n=1 Tax=Sandarakinorhabdus sp. DWP1-3-1 TaxID=2804627 RepID=UPI003CF5F26A